MTIEEVLRYLRAFYPGWDDEFAERLREQFDLDPGARTKGLSQGQRARTCLLTAMAYRPELLVLDEPSTGLDPIVRREILSAIIRTIAEEGRTVLFSSHLLDEVERMADWVAMIDRGRIVLCGPLEEIKAAHRRLTLRFDEPRSQPPGFGRFALTPRDSAATGPTVCQAPAEALADRLRTWARRSSTTMYPRWTRSSWPGSARAHRPRWRAEPMRSPAIAIAWQIWTRHRLGLSISAACLLLMVVAFPPLLLRFDNNRGLRVHAHSGRAGDLRIRRERLAVHRRGGQPDLGLSAKDVHAARGDAHARVLAHADRRWRYSRALAGDRGPDLPSRRLSAPAGSARRGDRRGSWPGSRPSAGCPSRVHWSALT